MFVAHIFCLIDVHWSYPILNGAEEEGLLLVLNEASLSLQKGMSAQVWYKSCGGILLIPVD